MQNLDSKKINISFVNSIGGKIVIIFALLILLIIVATEDIKNRILGIQDAVDLSITDISSVAKVVTDVNDIVNSIAGALEEQSVTSREITSNINEADTGVSDTAKLVAESATVSAGIAVDVSHVSQATDNVADQGEKIIENIANLHILAEKLQTIVDLFKL